MLHSSMAADTLRRAAGGKDPAALARVLAQLMGAESPPPPPGKSFADVVESDYLDTSGRSALHHAAWYVWLVYV